MSQTQQKIKIQTIKDVVQSTIPAIKEMVKMPAKNTWFLKFADANEMTDEVYATLEQLSFKVSNLSKDHNRKYKNIMATLDLTEVNAAYAHHYLYRGN